MEFSDFWQLCPRKVAKKDAQRMWARLTEQQQQKAIEQMPIHAKVWAAEGRQQHLIPHAATWLNGERFEDELAMPEPVRVENWKSPEWVAAEGRRRGIEAKRGEDLQTYIGRLRTA